VSLFYFGDFSIYYMILILGYFSSHLQCRINGRGSVRGAAVPGPMVLGTRNWWEWI